MPNIPLLKHRCRVFTLRPWPATYTVQFMCVCRPMSDYQLSIYSTIALTLYTCNKKIEKLPYREIQPLQQWNVTQETEMKKYHLRNNFLMIFCYCFFRSKVLTDPVVKWTQWSFMSSSSGHWKLLMFWTYSH